MRLNELYETHKNDLHFLCIYIREAHPDDGWRALPNVEGNIRFTEPTTDEERREVASVCQIALDIKMPLLVDSIDNGVEDNYISMPMRLFLVDRAGRLAYVGDEGPRGFDPDSWEQAIRDQIAGD